MPIALDVVKTRLQTEAKKGQTHYKGMGDAFVKICKLIMNLSHSIVDVFTIEG